MIWTSATIESDERENYKEIFTAIVKVNVEQKISLKASRYVENIIFKDGKDYFVNLFDLNFANDIACRKFELRVDGDYTLYDLLTKEAVEKIDGAYVGEFEKYRWFVLKRN